MAIAKIEQSGLHDSTLFDGYKSFDILSGTKQIILKQFYKYYMLHIIAHAD